jgi:hypothetical protein
MLHILPWQERTVVPAWSAKRRCTVTNTSQTGITTRISSIRVPTGTAGRSMAMGDIPLLPVVLVQ